MDEKKEEIRLPLARLEELETLKLHYQDMDDSTLFKWMQAVKGAHREAMAQLLRERGYPLGEE